MNKTLKILNRLREPSTWAGVSLLLTIAGVPPGVPEAIGQLLAGMGAVAAILLSEPGSPNA